MPYRIELFGDKVESIRMFDTETQLSLEQKEDITIIPDMQSHFTEAKRESLLKLLSDNTNVWLYDLSYILEIIDRCYEKIGLIKENFSNINNTDIDPEKEENNQILKSIISNPDNIFINKKEFSDDLQLFSTIEFGKRYY